ncbi:uncharacterized protein LOC135206586 [Macrobrachium nipponense]|uniref:uncharacterized protein LOC135206586 n=1 Tax=Macrobrachium nipponense TaxID=159736 RepID=UPI0030C7FC01
MHCLHQSSNITSRMKIIIISALATLSIAAPQYNYSPPPTSPPPPPSTTPPLPSTISTVRGARSRPKKCRSQDSTPVAILRDERTQSEDGTFKFEFEGDNGIVVSGSGSATGTNGSVVQREVYNVPGIPSAFWHQFLHLELSLYLLILDNLDTMFFSMEVTAPDGTPVDVTYVPMKKGSSLSQTVFPRLPNSPTRFLSSSSTRSPSLPRRMQLLQVTGCDSDSFDEKIEPTSDRELLYTQIDKTQSCPSDMERCETYNWNYNVRTSRQVKPEGRGIGEIFEARSTKRVQVIGNAIVVSWRCPEPKPIVYGTLGDVDIPVFIDSGASTSPPIPPPYVTPKPPPPSPLIFLLFPHLPLHTFHLSHLLLVLLNLPLLTLHRKPTTPRPPPPPPNYIPPKPTTTRPPPPPLRTLHLNPTTTRPPPPPPT